MSRCAVLSSRSGTSTSSPQLIVGPQLQDRVRFEAPLGVLGRLAERLILGRYMPHLIDVRNEYLVATAGRMIDMESFHFAVDPALRRWSRAFGVRPENCTATLSPAELSVTFGRWSMSTSPANVAAVSVTGPYRWWKVAGPPRLSLVDRGITFATTAEHGVCIELRQAVGAIDPLHLIRHPNVTITVAEPQRFADEVRRAASADHPTRHTRRSAGSSIRHTSRNTPRPATVEATRQVGHGP